MKYLSFKNTRVLGAILLSGVLFASCEKTDVKYESGRPVIVKTPQAASAINVIARDVSPTIESFELITVTRDVTNPAQLNSSMTIKLTKNASLIDDYNTANHTEFVELPSAAYTLDTDLSAVTFAPGEFAKKIKMTIDKSHLDLSEQYALGLTISEAPSDVKISVEKDALFSIGIKNAYDGAYTLNGAFYHPTSSPGYDAFTLDVELHTSGPNSVKLYIPEFGGYYGPGLFSGVLNAFGLQEPEYTVNPVTLKVTAQNSYSAAVTFYTMAPGYDSHWDPATKTMYVKYGYNYSAGPVFNPALNREWTYQLVYEGPR